MRVRTFRSTAQNQTSLKVASADKRGLLVEMSKSHCPRLHGRPLNSATCRWPWPSRGQRPPPRKSAEGKALFGHLRRRIPLSVVAAGHGGKEVAVEPASVEASSQTSNVASAKATSQRANVVQGPTSRLASGAPSAQVFSISFV